MQIVKISLEENPEIAHTLRKKIVIEGFKHEVFFSNGTLYITSEDFINLQSLMLDVYYS